MQLLSDVLDVYTKEDLKKYAKNLKMKNYSTLKKEALAKKIAEVLLLEPVMKQRL